MATSWRPLGYDGPDPSTAARFYARRRRNDAMRPGGPRQGGAEGAHEQPQQQRLESLRVPAVQQVRGGAS